MTPGAIDIGRAVSLPTILNDADVIRYRSIFALQQGGHWAAADLLIARLDDDLLMGHVLEQRYMHPTAYRSEFEELSVWLEAYADHPGAIRIYRLAMRRKPPDAPAPEQPSSAYLAGSGVHDGAIADITIPARSLSEAQGKLVNGLRSALVGHISQGRPVEAAQVLTDRGMIENLSEAEYDVLRTRVATSYFIAGDPGRSFELAAAAAARSGPFVPEAHWQAGLAAWQLDDMLEARRHFEILARLESADDWLRSAAAYWAARVHRRADRPHLADRLLAIAAEYPRSFYGLLAHRALDRAPSFAWDQRPLTSQDLLRLLRRPAARRAIALVEAGQRTRAEREIRKLYPESSPGMAGGLLSLAGELQLPAVQIRIGGLLAKSDGRRHDDALYPLSPWEPRNGYEIDRALMHAIIRQESAFDPLARSHRGAAGLMQLMPSTASYVDGEEDYEGNGADQLLDPELNVELGQRYLQHLLEMDLVESNLFNLAVAYNSGPMNLQRWREHIDDQDPLMFIESIPSRETRRFIQRVLTNLWIYRMRFEQPTPSLDAIARDRWPTYTELDSDVMAADYRGEN